MQFTDFRVYDFGAEKKVDNKYIYVIKLRTIAVNSEDRVTIFKTIPKFSILKQFEFPESLV